MGTVVPIIIGSPKKVMKNKHSTVDWKQYYFFGAATDTIAALNSRSCNVYAPQNASTMWLVEMFSDGILMTAS